MYRFGALRGHSKIRLRERGIFRTFLPCALLSTLRNKPNSSRPLYVIYEWPLSLSPPKSTLIASYSIWCTLNANYPQDIGALIRNSVLMVLMTKNSKLQKTRKQTRNVRDFCQFRIHIRDFCKFRVLCKFRVFCQWQMKSI